MKTILCSIIFTIGLSAQATFPIQIPGEASVSVTLSSEAVSAVTLFIKSVPATGPGTAVTLAADASSGATTYQLSSTAGVATGMGAVIAGEVSTITAVSSPNITVVRARLGTSAAAHTTGNIVAFLRSGSYSIFVANLIADSVQQAMLLTPGPAVVAAKAQLTTDQAAIVTLQAAGVTHVP